MSDEQSSDATGEGPKDDEAGRDDPGKAFKEGIGLLWKAARDTARQIKHEVDKGGISEALQAAGRELEHAATTAAKQIEQLIEKVQPVPPTYSKSWPPAAKGEEEGDEAAEPKQADADVPEDGGVDEKTGEKRDMRILVDGDDPT